MPVVNSIESDAENPCAGLLHEARAGSNSSLGQLLQSYRDYLYLLADEELGAELHVKAAASDLVQDSFLEAKRDFGQFTGNSSDELQAWLRRLLLNNVANVIRSYRSTEKRDVSREVTYWSGRRTIDGLVSDDHTPSSIMAQDEQLDSLQAALGRLPEHYRTVIVWRSYERMSFEQVGERLERTAEAAQALGSRCRIITAGTGSGKWHTHRRTPRHNTMNCWSNTTKRSRPEQRDRQLNRSYCRRHWITRICSSDLIALRNVCNCWIRIAAD